MSQAFPNATRIMMETKKVLGALIRSVRND
jgi:hypothetical protein